MSNIFFYVAAAGYILSAICVITAVVLFFKFQIPYVIKDLNGTIAQKEISDLRKKTATGKNSHIQIYDPDKFSGKLSGNTGMDMAEEVQQEEKMTTSEPDTEMRTSILEYNKVISKDFIIVTDIIFVNTDEKI